MGGELNMGGLLLAVGLAAGAATLLGGWLASYFLHMGDPVTGINVQSIIVAFVGAVIFVILLRLISGRRV